MKRKWLYTVGFAAMLLYALVPVTSTAFADNALRLACMMLIFAGIMREDLQGNGIMKFMALYVVALVLSSLMNPNIKTGLGLTWQRFFEMTPFIIIVMMLNNKMKIYSILNVYLFAMLIANATYIYQFITQFVMAKKYGYRASGLFYWEDWFMQIFLLVAIPIGVAMIDYLWESKNKWEKILIALTLCTSVMSCLMSFSRGIWLTLVMFAVAYSVIRLYGKIRILLLVIAGMLLVLSISMTVFPIFKERAMSIFNMNMAANSNRILAWQSSWNMFRDHPLLGVGQGNWFKNYKEKYINPAETETVPNAHSIYMQTLAETGMIGFLTYVAMMSSVLYMAVKRWRQAQTDEQRAGATIMFFAMLNYLFIGVMGDFKDTRTVVEVLWFAIGSGYILSGTQNDLYRKRIEH